MLSCTHCRHAAVSRIQQKRKFCKMNQSDCRNHKFPGFHDFMLDAIRGISSLIKFKWKTSTVVESKSRLTSKKNFVLDSTTFLNFRVPDSTKSSKIACLCTVMFGPMRLSFFCCFCKYFKISEGSPFKFLVDAS